MRGLWCLLLVMSLLAPLGSAGITIGPREASAQHTTPRTGIEIATTERRELPDRDAVAVSAVTTRVRSSEHGELAPRAWTVAPALAPRLAGGPLGSRAPPA